MTNDRVAHILGHLHRHTGIVQPHDLRLRWQREFEQRIDTGTNVEQALQLRLLINETLRWRPHHGMVCQLGGLASWGSLPFPNVNAGQGLAKALKPWLCFGIGATKNYFHMR